MKTALIAGATGLIGRQLLDLLLAADDYSQVVAFSRRPIDISNSKLKVIIIADVNSVDSHFAGLKVDDIFCCLGTTIKVAGSKAAFRLIDYDYPVAVAKAGITAGAQQYLLVSSLGANKGSGIFYNQVKGETEESISAIGFRCLHILRPSMLLGDRREHRPTEEAAKTVYKIFGFLIPKKYLAIDSLKVARAMVKLAGENKTGLFVHESSALQKF